MNTPAQFDCYSDSYRKLLDQSVRLSGESGEYFARVKAQYLARRFGKGFTGKVLDFGSGVGLLAQALLTRMPACSLHGYDPSKASVDKVSLAVRLKGTFSCREEELDHDYNLIIVANVMHHIELSQREGIIANLKCRLAPNGSIVVFEHNPANPLTRWAVHICPFDAGVVLLWPGEVRRHFARAGLRFARLDYIAFFPRWLSRLRPFEPHLSWCPLGAQYAIVGQVA